MSHRPHIPVEARHPHFIGRCSICETTVTAEGPDGDDGAIAADGKPIHYVCEDRARATLAPDPCSGSDARYDDGRCRTCDLQVGTYDDGPAGLRLRRHLRPVAKAVLSGEWLYDGEKYTHGYEAHSATFGPGGWVEAYATRDVMDQLVADHARERAMCSDLDDLILGPDGTLVIHRFDGSPDQVIVPTPDGNYRLPEWTWQPVIASDCVAVRVTRLAASWQEHRGDVNAALQAGHVETGTER